MLSFYDYQFFTKNIMTDSLKMVIKSTSPTIRYRYLRKSKQECSEHVLESESLLISKRFPQIALHIKLATLIVEAVGNLVANYVSDSAKVHVLGTLGVKEVSLQDAGREF